MAEEIEIVNVGGDGVASEATLKSLADSIKALARSTGKDPRAEEAKLIKTANEARKSGIKVIKDQNDAMDDLTTSTEHASRQMDRMGRGMGNLVLNGLGAVLGSAVNLGKELAFGGDRMTDFARHLPVVGEHLAVLTQFVDEQIDSFRQLAGVGVDFGETIFEVKRQAAVAGISLDSFQAVVMNNTEALARIGGNAERGARAFAQVSGIVQGNLGPQLSRLGITMEEAGELTTSYLNTQTRIGRAQSMSQEQLGAGASEYLLQLDRLSKLTGKSREQLAAELEQDAITPAMRILRSSLADGGAEISMTLKNLESSVGPEAAEALEQLIARNGVPIANTLGAGLAQLNPEIMALAQGLRNGSMGMEDAVRVFGNTQQIAKQRAEAEGDVLTVLADQGNVQALAVASMLGVNQTTEDLISTEELQQQAMDDSTRGLLDFERQLAQIRNSFNSMFVENGIFGALQEGISNALSGGLNGLLTSGAVVAAVAGAIGAGMLASRLGEALGDSGGRRRGGGGRGGMLGAAGRGAGAGLSGLGRGAGAGIAGLGNGIAAAGLKSPAIIAGGIAIGAAIAAIGAGIAGATWLMGEALPNLAEGLEPFERLDGAALKSASGGLLALSGGIAAFGVGNFVAGIANLGSNAMDAIGSFFGGTTVFEKIKQFNDLQINADTMKANADAIVAFGNAMGSLTGLDDAAFSNMTANLFDGITNLFGGDTGLPLAQIQAFGAVVLNKENIKNNSEAVVAYAEAMNGLTPGQDAVGTLISNVFDTITSVFFGKSYPWDIVKKFEDAGLDKVKITAQSEAVAAFATAMSLFPADIPTERVGGVFGAIKDIFFGEVEFPWDAVKTFGDAQINAQGVTDNAAAMVAFADGIAGFASTDIESVVIPNMRNLTVGVGDLNNAFDAEKIDNYEDALWNLKDTISDLNDEIRENNSLAASTIDNAAAARSGDGGGGGGSNRALIQLLTDLNTTMTNIKDELDDQGDTQDRTLRAVRSLSGTL